MRLRLRLRAGSPDELTRGAPRFEPALPTELEVCFACFRVSGLPPAAATTPDEVEAGGAWWKSSEATP